jgi:hypothetical protein
MTLRWKCIILGVELPRRENLERVVEVAWRMIRSATPAGASS